MSHFNRYMNTHFAGCRLLAEGFDQVRTREVRVYMVPGHHEDVGVTDGTDAWVMPLAAEGYGGLTTILKGIGLRDIITRILAGETVAVARRGPDPAPRARRRLVEDDAPVPTTQQSRRRHVSF